MSSGKVLVIGGRGYFGQLLIDDLLRNTDCELTVSSRNRFRSNRYDTLIADLRDPDSLKRVVTGMDVVICTAGPFQGLPSTPAELCVSRGIHYIDLADDRGFVRRVRSLVSQPESCANAVCTGWSTVPALSGLLAGIASEGMQSLHSIYIHLAPGNRGARQTGTIASLLHSVGQSFVVWRDGKPQSVVGWSDPGDFVFPPPVGKRRGYLVDVPDHEIFPKLFAADTVEFRVGSEFRILNHCLSLLRRTRLNWASWSGLFERALALSSWVGHDWGAVGVEVSGPVSRRAYVIADSHAGRIAVMPASVMAAILLAGAPHRGLVSYKDWMSREQLRAECEKRGFRFLVEDA